MIYSEGNFVCCFDVVDANHGKVATVTKNYNSRLGLNPNLLYNWSSQLPVHCR